MASVGPVDALLGPLVFQVVGDLREGVGGGEWGINVYGVGGVSIRINNVSILVFLCSFYVGTTNCLRSVCFLINFCTGPHLDNILLHHYLNQFNGYCTAMGPILPQNIAP